MKEVQDLVIVKTAFQLSDDDVATAINERAERIYRKYGTPSLLVNTESLTTVSSMVGATDARSTSVRYSPSLQ